MNEPLTYLISGQKGRRKKSGKKLGKKLKGEKKVERGNIEHKICMALTRLRRFLSPSLFQIRKFRFPFLQEK